MVESAKSAKDQRHMRRFSMQLPVQVKAPEDGQEVLAITKDVSARGVFIYLDSDVSENSPIEFTLTLPPEITMTQSIRVHCKGRVVRVERERPGKVGIAAMIDHYQFLETEQ
ncbi:MAG TPA: PilZ domain-containing protein [Terriglobales bacterium]|nr:PilZ domain-containing protein [Terriglobales bacterium]